MIVRLGNVRFTDCPTTVSATSRKQHIRASLASLRSAGVD